MPVTITREQRDAIYEAVMNHLSGIGDVGLLVDNGDATSAQRLARTFVEDLRLLEDLGWAAQADAETVTLTMASGELTRAFTRLHHDAADALAAYVSRPKEDEEIAQGNLAAADALAAVLGQIAQPTADDEVRREAGR
ncbi:hypothetical protein AB0L40_24280 [Patulibacter sp. NPDC049589]|uniref:hypothetical protein n=1 Tax=Patulibacter sp. NPDC049589 TaxID=3154731 RepID=UPI0034135C41